MTHPPISEAVRATAEAYAVACFVLRCRFEEAREYAMTDDSDSLNAGITEAKANADAALANLIAAASRSQGAPGEAVAWAVVDANGKHTNTPSLFENVARMECEDWEKRIALPGWCETIWRAPFRVVPLYMHPAGSPVATDTKEGA